MATIRTIANDLNLSPATVSRALRGRGGVNAATRAKVRLAAERLGYSRASVADTVKTVAVLVSSRTRDDMHELARRHLLVINEEFSRRGWRLHPIFVPDTDEGDRALAELTAGSAQAQPRMDGCLVIGRLSARLSDRYHQSLAERFNGNVVMVCRHDVLAGISGVTQMNHAGGIQAAQAILDAGHRRIGWIGALGSRDTARERLGGVMTTLPEQGGSLTCQLWLNERDLLPAAAVADALAEALPERREDWPTAWICAIDWLAAKLMVWARGQGLRVPHDMSVVAFDNTHIAEDLAESVITSVVYPYEQIARKSVELLELLMSSPVADAIVWSLPSRLRVGETLVAPAEPEVK